MAIPIELRSTIPPPETPPLPASESTSTESFVSHLTHDRSHGGPRGEEENAVSEPSVEENSPTNDKAAASEESPAVEADAEEETAADSTSDEHAPEKVRNTQDELRQDLLDASEEGRVNVQDDIVAEESDPRDTPVAVEVVDVAGKDDVAVVDKADAPEVRDQEIGDPASTRPAVDTTKTTSPSDEADTRQETVDPSNPVATSVKTVVGEDEQAEPERRPKERKTHPARRPADASAAAPESADEFKPINVRELGLTPVDEATTETEVRSSRRSTRSVDSSSVAPGSEAATANRTTGEEANPSRGATPASGRLSDPLLPTADKAGGRERMELTGPQQARFVDRVARAFQAAEGRGGPIRLRLHPPELGNVRLEMRVQDGALTARVEAETASARALLIENIPVLRERLAEQGIRIEQFDVGLEQQGGTGPEVPDDRDGSSAQRDTNDTFTEAADDPSSSPPRSPWGNDSGLDVVI